MTPPSHRSDITNRQDIVRLVDAFYERIRKDDKLGPIFEDIAHVNWETHLPRMYDFWDSVIFRTGTFRGNPLVTHAKLGPMANMGRATFDRWLTLFRETVSELFTAGSMRTPTHVLIPPTSLKNRRQNTRHTVSPLTRQAGREEEKSRSCDYSDTQGSNVTKASLSGSWKWDWVALKPATPSRGIAVCATLITTQYT